MRPGQRRRRGVARRAGQEAHPLSAAVSASRGSARCACASWAARSGWRSGSVRVRGFVDSPVTGGELLVRELRTWLATGGGQLLVREERGGGGVLPDCRPVSGGGGVLPGRPAASGGVVLPGRPVVSGGGGVLPDRRGVSLGGGRLVARRRRAALSASPAAGAPVPWPGNSRRRTVPWASRACSAAPGTAGADEPVPPRPRRAGPDPPSSPAGCGGASFSVPRAETAPLATGGGTVVVGIVGGGTVGDADTWPGSRQSQASSAYTIESTCRPSMPAHDAISWRGVHARIDSRSITGRSSSPKANAGSAATASSARRRPRSSSPPISRSSRSTV